MRGTRDTRLDIINAARENFARKGFQGATIAEIAEAAGISEGAIYRHFNSKHELLVECVEPVLNELVEVMDKEVPRADDLMELTKKSLEIRLNMFGNHYHTFRILFNELPYSKELFDIYINFIMKQEGKISQMFESLEDLGIKKQRKNFLLFGLGQVMSLWIYLNLKEWQQKDQINFPEEVIAFDDEQVVEDLAEYIMYGIAGVPYECRDEEGDVR